MNHFHKRQKMGLILVIALLAIPLLFLLLRCWQHSTGSVAIPPGPPALPIIGHLHLLGELPHRALMKIAQKYGPLVRLRLGSIPVLFASSPDMAKELLKTHDHVFASRPRNMTAELLGYESKDLILAPYGEYWRTLRTLCMQELLSEKNIASFENVRTEEISLMMLQFLEASQKRDVEAVAVQDLLSEFTYNTLTMMLMGKAYCGPKHCPELEEIKQFKEFKKVTREVVLLSGRFHVGDYIPFLKWFDSGAARMRAVHTSVDEFWQTIIQERRKNRPADFLSTLLSLPSKCTREQDDAIKALMQGLIAAGTDTAAVTVEWAMAELLHQPQILAKAHDELESLVGKDRLVQESDLHRLKYLQAIIKETFRLHPPVPLTVPHMSMEDCKVGGYYIPKGTRLFVNIHAIGRDPSVWKLPELFSPERFLDKDIDVRGHNFELIPFGAGRRGCPGVSMSLTSVQLLLVNMLHAFEWRLPNGTHPLHECFGTVTPMAVPLKAIPSPRLPSHVYNLPALH